MNLPLQSVVRNYNTCYTYIKSNSFSDNKISFSKVVLGFFFNLMVSTLIIAAPLGLPSTVSTTNIDKLLTTTTTASIDTSTIKVINETTCPMTIFCYELDETGELINMGILKAGQSITIQPRAELGRLYAEDVLTQEETASLYFFGGAFELKIVGACGRALVKDSTVTVDNSSEIYNIIDTIVYDCSKLKVNIGDACYDGYPSTEEDVITANCTCEGTRISSTISPCDSFKITTTNEYIIIKGLNTARVNSIQIFTMNWKSVYTCAGNCKAIEYIPLPNASYRVRVTSYTNAWAQVCNASEIISVQKSFVDEEVATLRQGPASITNTSPTATPFSTPTLSAYPNPASDEITVTLQNDRDQNGRIQLVNLNGQIIRSINVESLTSTTWQVEVGDIKKGIYMLQYINNQNFKVAKVLIE